MSPVSEDRFRQSPWPVFRQVRSSRCTCHPGSRHGASLFCTPFVDYPARSAFAICCAGPDGGPLPRIIRWRLGRARGRAGRRRTLASPFSTTWRVGYRIAHHCTLHISVSWREDRHLVYPDQRSVLVGRLIVPLHADYAEPGDSFRRCDRFRGTVAFGTMSASFKRENPRSQESTRNIARNP
jgi:hypothetical protein